MRIAVFFVGNRLMLDDGIGPAVYDYIVENYNFGNETSANEVLANVHPSSERVATSKATTSSMVQSTVDMFDVGCIDS